MKAIGRNLIVNLVKQGVAETKGGLLLAEKQREDIRYNEGIVISAGNYFSTTKFPANHPDVFAISAVDGNKKPLKTTKWQSSFGNNILIAAPGNNIITTDIPDGAGIHELPIRGSNNYYKNYTYFHGTSAAAPIVSGCIARLLKHDNTLTLNEIKNLFLNDKSLDSFNPNFNNPNNNYYGAGIINLEKITKCFLE